MTTHVVRETFVSIQGEGPFSGRPASFIRFAGCNLHCKLCDTDHTSMVDYLSDEDLVNFAKSSGPRLVVLTGGEPLTREIGGLVRRLLECAFTVQLETNGTRWDGTIPWWNGNLFAVISPKTDGIFQLWNDLPPARLFYKYIVRAGFVDEADGLPLDCLGKPGRPSRPRPGLTQSQIFLSPADEKETARNVANAQAAIASCLRFGYSFSPQLHKLFGLR